KTNPNAFAPASLAASASSRFVIPQILIQVIRTAVSYQLSVVSKTTIHSSLTGAIHSSFAGCGKNAAQHLMLGSAALLRGGNGIVLIGGFAPEAALPPP